MALGPGVQLHLKQQQTLVMTPQLQQAIKMLQLSRLDLTNYVEEALASNPMLERAEGDANNAGDSVGAGDSMLLSADGLMTRIGQHQTSAAEASDRAADLSEAGPSALGADENGANGIGHAPGGEDAPIYPLDWREDQRLEEGATPRSLREAEVASTQAFELSAGPNAATAGDFGADFRPTDFAEPLPSLHQHVSQALPLLFDDALDLKIAESLCFYLSPAGYLDMEAEALAEQLGIDGDHLERIVVTCQQIEPAGLFARSLAECLVLQLQDRGQYSALLAKLLADLEGLAGLSPRQGAERLGCSQSAYSEALALIRRLDPKPGARFDSGNDGMLEADIFLRPAEGGAWLVELNTNNLPRLLVNQSFAQHSASWRSDIKTTAKSDKTDRQQDDARYISEQWQSANWLVSALEQRANTMLRVACALVEAQAAFFEQGLYALKPLVQRQLAERLDLHESTISRVCANKYISTPRGTYELKFFFSSSVGGGEVAGDGQAAKAVQAHIKRLIEEEDHKRPLSDDKIVKLLAAEKIGLARRTVTKYREALGFGSSVQRKRQYAASS